MEAKSTTSTSSMQKNVDRNIERVSQGAHQAVDRAADAASSVAGRFGDTVEQLADRRDELMELPEVWMEGARGYVREHPFASVGIALAAGYLLHMITRSK
jgi:ElaB/YqjD/DUF883 family membrane-anchored ribosome-binding protein